MSLRIRLATIDDLAVLKAILREEAEHLNAIADPEPIDEAEIERIEHLAFGPAAVCAVLLAEDGDTVAAYLAYSWGLAMEGVAPALVVGGLFVREGHRRRGLGRSLMEEACAIGRAAGAPQVNWTVWSKNVEAQRFYESLGARRYDEEVLMTWPGG